MIRWGLVFWAASAALPAQAEVVRADYADLAGRLAGRLDFEDYPAKPEPGLPIDGLIVAEGIIPRLPQNPKFLVSDDPEAI